MGAFCKNVVSTLAILDGKQNSMRYIDTLGQFFLQFTREKYYSVWIFQQDHSLTHSAKKTKL